MKRTITSLFFFGLAGLSLAVPQIVDCLVAVVNGQAVTLADFQIAREFELFAGDVEGRADDPRLAVLDAIINQKIALEIAREPVTIGKDEIALAVDALRAKLGPDIFLAKLRKFGLDEADLRPYLEERIRYGKVVFTRFSATVPVSRGDVEKFYREVYVPERKAEGLEPEKMETIISALEARVRENLKARQVAEWLRNIRSQAEVRINKDCLDSAKENTP
ncbi:MAG: hypothetical protein ABSG19_06295 [Candidatus Aminicenantales bacterium]